MIVKISNDAENDIREGYWFYEEQSDGLGDYFRDCIIADIDSLAFHRGVHEVAYGYHRMLSIRFSFAIYYSVARNWIRLHLCAGGSTFGLFRHDIHIIFFC